MRFIQTYKSPNVIGIGDNVRYKNKSYLVLINYIKGETDAKGYTPKSNRTILIDDNVTFYFLKNDTLTNCQLEDIGFYPDMGIEFTIQDTSEYFEEAA